MNGFPYLRIASLIFNQPHMVLPGTMDMVTRWADQALNLNMVNVTVAQMGRPMAYEDDDWGDYEARQAARAAERQAAVHATGVQVIPVHGLLVSRSMHVDPCTTSTSYEGLRSQIRAALADPMVEHIVMDIDTPGGSVAGCFELASEIHAAREQKPFTSIVNHGAYSAGYALGSAAGKVIVSQSSGVGSIGVIARHADFSGQMEKAGVKVTTIYAGAHKNDMSPYEPLSDAAAESLRQLVNESYEDFVAAVAKHRGLDPSAVRGTEASVFYGQNAVNNGLADSVETPQAAVDRIAADVAAARSARARPVTPSRKASAVQAMAAAAAVSID